MTPVLPATPEAIARAAAILRDGGLVAFPTETVYGLGADARNETAVAALYAAKGRPRFNPLIAHVESLDAAVRLGRFGPEALRLAETFWPGPLTLVVPALADGVSLLARAGLGSVALRVPAHPVAQALLHQVARPVVAPSANRSGRISPTTAAHVQGDLDGRVALILDAGPCPLGLESTVVSCLDTPRLLRPGGLPVEAVEAAVGHALARATEDAGEAPAAPGLLASHYAPGARVRLHAEAVGADEAVLDFGGRLARWRGTRPYVDLSLRANLDEAAARLFAALHALDASGAQTIAVAPVPDEGLGAAINDRLARAAAPRP